MDHDHYNNRFFLQISFHIENTLKIFLEGLHGFIVKIPVILRKRYSLAWLMGKLEKEDF